MTVTKVNADVLDLTDAYALSGAVAFSGTVTGAGKIVQVVNVQELTYSTGTTQLPLDNTITQNTEGDEYMTLAITPTSATNKLHIEVVWSGGSNSAGTMSIGLFQDSTAGALNAGIHRNHGANEHVTLVLDHYMTSGTVSATTFKIRAGLNASGTTYHNGSNGARRMGGILASSITITEITV
jgi:hypothetical protein